ncbi:crotonase/enoyl-CoA hydratase family protein [Jiella sp. M17.18]|uniref:crotonase/enoyl-CoA hydratase family protein n=1 Tax=Jiella sp. M17.18 TaxID=3234247 RepID=UPI0034E01AA5
MSEHIATALADGVLTVRLNRPEKKNAITRDMYRGMTAALERAEAEAEIAAVLFCGVPGAFCAGNDIKDFLAIAEGGALPGEIRDFLQALVAARKPLIAAVDGLAIGIGTTLLMHCDLTYAAPASVFRTPFLDLGLTPEAGSSLIAPRLMGLPRAFALLVLGEAFDAEAAKAAGLVYAVTDDPEAAALDAAKRLAAKPPEALSIARALLRGTQDDVAARIDQEIGYFADRLMSSEAKAAFQAFMAR